MTIRKYPEGSLRSGIVTFQFILAASEIEIAFTGSLLSEFYGQYIKQAVCFKPVLIINLDNGFVVYCFERIFGNLT